MSFDPTKNKAGRIVDVFEWHYGKLMRVDEIFSHNSETDPHSNRNKVELRCDRAHLLNDVRFEAGLLAKCIELPVTRTAAGLRHYDQPLVGEFAQRNRPTLRKAMFWGHRYAERARLDAYMVKHCPVALRQKLRSVLACGTKSWAHVHEARMYLSSARAFGCSVVATSIKDRVTSGYVS